MFQDCLSEETPRSIAQSEKKETLSSSSSENNSI